MNEQQLKEEKNAKREVANTLVWTSLACLKWNGTCLFSLHGALCHYIKEIWWPKRTWKVKRESIRSSINKWRKTLYRDYLHRFANFCATVLNILSKEIISNTKCRKQILKSILNTWKYWWNETDGKYFKLYLQNFSELWNLFPRIPLGNCFWCYFRQIYKYLWLLENAKGF